MQYGWGLPGSFLRIQICKIPNKIDGRVAQGERLGVKHFRIDSRKIYNYRKSWRLLFPQRSIGRYLLGSIIRTNKFHSPKAKEKKKTFEPNRKMMAIRLPRWKKCNTETDWRSRKSERGIVMSNISIRSSWNENQERGRTHNYKCEDGLNKTNVRWGLFAGWINLFCSIEFRRSG